MTRLYPITKISPASVETQEKTNLPFGFVLQPFASFKKSQSNTNKLNNDNNRKKTEVVAPPLKSYLLPKCTKCGAPLHPGAYFIDDLTVQCPYCGTDFRVDFESQLRSQGYSDESESINYESRKEKYLNRLRRYGSLEERRRRTVEYELPLLRVATKTTSTSASKQEIFSLPVSMCPPIITVIIDGTSKDPQYYKKICSSLQYLLDHGASIPHPDTDRTNNNTKDFKGRRLGIFVMGSKGSLSVFDLKSPNAHLKHTRIGLSSSLKPNPKFKKEGQGDGLVYQTENYDDIPLSDILDVENIYVPLDSDYSRSCIESAMRVLADTTILNQICLRNNHNNKSKVVVGETYLGSTIRYILDYFDEIGYHPGMYQSELSLGTSSISSDGNVVEDDNAIQKFLYSGGKMICFLAGPPKEIGTSRNYNVGQIGSGGFGGSCAEVGKRYSQSKFGPSSSNDVNEGTADDIELGGGSHHVKEEKSSSSTTVDEECLPQVAYSNVDDYYQDLGVDCSYYAHSVEIFGLVNESSMDDGKQHSCYLGFNYLRLLNDRSGGNGPIVVSLSQASSDILEREVLSRSTLKRPTAYGSSLKVRMTQSLAIDDDMDDALKKTHHSQRNDKKYSRRMLQYLHNNGMHGPVSFIDHDNILFFNDDEMLFIMGTCDVSTTLAFDVKFVLGSTIASDFERESGIRPSIQFCFAYTTTIRNGSSNDMSVVRRLRVSNFDLPSSDVAEAVTASLNTEALAVNVFHKLSLMSSLQYNSESIKEVVENWLLDVLLECYRSAEDIKEKVDNYGMDAYHNDNFDFYPQHRLLNSTTSSSSAGSSNDMNEFTIDEILLGQGHEEIRHIPLLMYCLLQCDGLRPSNEKFNPSIDARCAALASMSNMPPSTLSRCIAPRLELWKGGADTKEAMIDFLSLNRKDVMDDIDSSRIGNDGALLFLDSPRQVVIYDCIGFGAKKAIESRNDIPVQLSAAKADALKSYRVAPSQTVAIGDNAVGGAMAHHIQDAFIEDANLHGESYQDWLRRIARLLHRLGWNGGLLSKKSIIMKHFSSLFTVS